MACMYVIIFIDNIYEFSYCWCLLILSDCFVKLWCIEAQYLMDLCLIWKVTMLSYAAFTTETQSTNRSKKKKAGTDGWIEKDFFKHL